MDRIISTNEVLGPRFEAALLYASAVHAHQRRKGGDIPYVSHLLAVAALVIEDGAAAGRLSEDEAIAALLRDAAEDAGGEPRLRDIRARFGERVADIVAACSDTFENPKPPWRARKEAYLAHLEHADEGVLRVSLADKVHNARAILADYRQHGDALWGRFDADADALWYYRSVSEVLSRRLPGPLAEELERTVAEMERLAAPTDDGPDVVVHADWGVKTQKRWIARATRVARGWLIDAIQRYGGSGTPLERLGIGDRPTRALIGFDFPIGLPQAYADQTGITSFHEVLPRLGAGPWSNFFDVAEKPDEIGLRRPFYPSKNGPAGAISQPQLAERLGIPFPELRRRCELATEDHPAACVLFWTLGANQVGKGTIAGWKEVIVPLLRDPGHDVALWPFDGELAELAANHRVVLVETYPAEYYAQLGIHEPKLWSKRNQNHRRARAATLIAAADAMGATVADGLRELIEDGFGSRPDGEDPFDALVGLLGMLRVLESCAEAPNDSWTRAVEGWILGQPVSDAASSAA